MYLLHLAALIFVSANTVFAQDIVYDSIHNATTIYGTWASGAKNVVTGSGFANPANESFTYPKTTGVSYSFSEDGFYEIARYRFTGNGSQPNCITGVVNWVHGTYDLVANGSITMTPFGDGFQQIQDSCAATSNFIELYNDTELYASWRIFTDPTDGYKLHLFNYDGSPVAPQFQVSATPNMLATYSLRNTTTTIEKRSFEKRGFFKRSTSGSASTRWSTSRMVAGFVGLGAVSFLAACL